MLNSFSARNSAENLRQLIGPVGRDQERNRMSDNLTSDVAIEALRAPVPTHNGTVHSYADDGIVGGFDDRGQSGSHVLFPLLARDLRLQGSDPLAQLCHLTE